MLYDELNEEAVLAGSGSAALERLRDDARQADLVAFVGVSFEQSASVEYYRIVRRAMNAEDAVYVVNPDNGNAANNLATATSFDTPLGVVHATASSMLGALVRQGVSAAAPSPV